MAKWPYSTTTWQRLRSAKLSTQPLCEVCIRREVVEPASVVDHVVAINAGGDPFPPLSGLMSMCEPCHSWKTNHEDRPDRQRKLGSAYKGSSVDGGSLDPFDDWSEPSPNVVAAQGIQHPRAFRGWQSNGQGPARKKRTELVSCESFATGRKEGN